MKKILFGLFIAAVLTQTAGAADYIQGKQYVVLDPAQPVDTGKKIEVRELFWYGCPHCYHLEPELNRWLKAMPSNTEFVRMPAVLRSSWAPHARAFYTFEALGVTAKLHDKLFDAIHKDGRHIDDLKGLADFAAENGVDRKLFTETYNSFGVDSEVRKAQVMGRNYQADGVPTIIVDGKYRTTASMAGSHPVLIKVINFLVKKAKAERKP